MTNDHDLTPGDEWPNHYRGYRLHTNADGDVWWQVYKGTDRLYLEPTSDTLIDQLLSVKRLGGRIRITEDNDVLARESVDDEYREIWVGTLELTGHLVPTDAPEHRVDVRPRDLSMGDLWPSVYDGAKYSFSGEQVWWTNPATRKRHPVDTPLPKAVWTALRQYKPNGGSFVVTPWNDVLTLVETHPATDRVRAQFGELPRVIQNVIKLRKERGVEMLPIYVGHLDQTPLVVSDPPSLTDPLSEAEQAELESWAASLGTTTTTDETSHRVSDDLPDDDPTAW